MEQHFVKYPIGIQNFESLRKEGYAYVDKTAHAWRLANLGRYYFLGRPRRFGKSLLLSTLEAYFQGKRELFEGLEIMQMEKEWKQYPVLHMDLNAQEYKCREDLMEMLDRHLRQWEEQYGGDPISASPSGRFIGVIRRAYEKTQMPVVILVDEYDKPMALNLDNEELQDEFRGILKAFYGVMKSADRYIKMGFLTGVTKFSKVSVFSDLNNINDISMDLQYATACGLTEQEILQNFDEGMALLAQGEHLSLDDCYAEMRHRYDGYHFCPDSPGMYNPFSVMGALSKQRFGEYWFETGTPTQIITMLSKTNYPLSELECGEVNSQLMDRIDSYKSNPVVVLYQSGYLTIKGYDREFREYQLGFPNKEVEDGFMNCLLPIYTNSNENPTQFNIVRFVKEVRDGQPEAFMTRLTAMMADTDYRIVGSSELYFQNFLFVFFRLLGLYVEVARATSDGRSDMVVQTPGYIYILEFKMDQTADAALQQIEQKGYALPFAADPRQVFKIGVNFNSQQRRVDEWKMT